MSRVPRATYRLQFHPGFGFADARRLVPYLHRLGIGDLYASPLLAARPGSTHGYDVIDPTRLNPELGPPEEFEALVAELQSRGMGLLLDFVPNHMAADEANPWWSDVLEHGPSSRYASFFDIDWAAGGDREARLLLPLLGAELEQAIANGEVALTLEESPAVPGPDPPCGVFLRYYERRFPLEPGSWPALLKAVAITGVSGASGLAELAARLESLPGYQERDEERARERWRGSEEAKRELGRLRREQPDLGARLSEAAAERDLLAKLAGAQPYRLAHYRTAGERLGYRRFLDINELVALRVEDPQVFAALHGFALSLVAEGKVTGLRLDHIDGLRDPLGYLERLRAALAQTEPAGTSGPPETGADGATGPPLYLVVEKILSGEERLPRAWPVHGTTGYDFLNQLGRLFVDESGLPVLDRLYARLPGHQEEFAATRYGAKKQVLESLFAAEMQALADGLMRLLAGDPEARTLSPEALTAALVEVTACLPVYRTYIRDFTVPPADRELIDRVVNEAQRRNAGRLASAFAYLRRLLSLRLPAEATEERRHQALEVVLRWQQLSSPAMAKGLEDTVFYRDNRLISLDEVGGEPELEPGVRDALHRRNLLMAESWSATMNASSTHDTKRSEDMRARIHVLSEIADEWAARVEEWNARHRDLRPLVRGQPVPDGNDELLLYQTLVGAWPLLEGEESGFKERLDAFLIKAAREEKLHTSWLQPDAEYEEARVRFTTAVLDASFLATFRPFQRRVAWYGALNSLGQVLVKIGSPGVPDFYQGTELWDFSMVDPDNRRAVDYERRASLLAELERLAAASDRPALCRALLTSWEDGRVKLFLTREALAFRRARRRLFGEGGYLPLEISGTRAANLFAFARHRQDEWALVIIPRLLTGLVAEGVPPLGEPVWGDDQVLLPPGLPESWCNVLTGEELRAAPTARGGLSLPVADLLRSFPAALLEGGCCATG